jgi:hypothetical protein
LIRACVCMPQSLRTVCRLVATPIIIQRGCVQEEILSYKLCAAIQEVFAKSKKESGCDRDGTDCSAGM